MSFLPRWLSGVETKGYLIDLNLKVLYNILYKTTQFDLYLKCIIKIQIQMKLNISFWVILLFSSICYSQNLSAQPMETHAASSKAKETLATVKKFNDAFNKHDVEAVMALMTDDCILENTNPAPDGTRLKGAEAVKAYWISFFTKNPDAYFEAEDVFAHEDRCVVRWIYRKTKDGNPWHLRGVDVFKVRDGKVAEKLAYVKG